MEGGDTQTEDGARRGRRFQRDLAGGLKRDRLER